MLNVWFMVDNGVVEYEFALQGRGLGLLKGSSRFRGDYRVFAL
jgi:hypothetical protein